MGKHIVVVGCGPGISTAVAERYGAEGFAVSLVARNEERLAAGVAALGAKGIRATAVPADASDASAIRAAVGKARAALGPVTTILWNAYGGADAGDLATVDVAAIRGVFDEMAVTFKNMGLALANGAKHKLVGLLAQRLKNEGVHVAEVVVTSSIKGTAWDRGNATLEGADVAKEFWRLHQGRSEVSARVG